MPLHTRHTSRDDRHPAPGLRGLPLGVLVTTSLALLALPASAQLFVTVPAIEFHDALGASAVLSELSPTGGLYQRYCTSIQCEMVADARLPHRAQLVGLELDGCQPSGSAVPLQVQLIKVPTEESQPAGVPLLVLVDLLPLPADPACRFETAEPLSPIVVDTFAATYLIRVIVGTSCIGVGCPPTPTIDQRFSAVRLYYRANGSGVVEPTAPSTFPIFPP